MQKSISRDGPGSSTWEQPGNLETKGGYALLERYVLSFCLKDTIVEGAHTSSGSSFHNRSLKSKTEGKLMIPALKLA